ncbi:winged helix-turn-helix domain-containing protein [Saccharopolyspora hattusasensis]|uniref:winged helix-turn-helix domain-containing protein n=1 Tax=Saccharopolyspora hattusasensis TaxID=1128679 RepID=UPI003D955A5B
MKRTRREHGLVAESHRSPRRPDRRRVGGGSCSCCTWECLGSSCRLGWSRQRPTRRAAERDEETIEEWISASQARESSPPDMGGMPTRGYDRRTHKMPVSGQGRKWDRTLSLDVTNPIIAGYQGMCGLHRMLGSRCFPDRAESSRVRCTPPKRRS